ncbi:hypothetical protein CLU79DRAFT_4726 [Phycomyces nitens]|nr:hypothetical protein CLU79DRAFT_4726 [Phycomyces nitens]
MTPKARGRKGGIRRGRPRKTSVMMEHSILETTSNDLPGIQQLTHTTHSVNPREERSYKDLFPDLNIKDALPIHFKDTPLSPCLTPWPSHVLPSTEDSFSVNISRDSEPKEEAYKPVTPKSNALDMLEHQDESTFLDITDESIEKVENSELSEATFEESEALDMELDTTLICNTPPPPLQPPISVEPQGLVTQDRKRIDEQLGVNLGLLPKPLFSKIVEEKRDDQVEDEDEVEDEEGEIGGFRRPERHYIRYTAI